MILNKWIDKTSGEEKKVNKIRILKMISPNELNQIFGPLEEVFSSQETFTDPAYDQTTSTNTNDNNYYQQNAYQNNQRNKQAYANNNANNANNNYKKRQPESNSNNDGYNEEDDSSNDRWSQNRDPRIPF